MQNTSKNPVVTVVTVVYNAVDKIEETILSVLSQDYDSMEYVVIDGGSTDGTIDVIRRYEEQLEYFVTEPDRGIYDAMNKGIANANGEWLSFMNAGDTFYDNHVIKNVFAVLAEQDYSEEYKIVYGDVAMKIVGQPEIVKRLDNIKQEDEPFSLNHQSTFTRVNFLREVGGYDTSYKIAADANSFYQAYLKGYKFVHVPVIISSYETIEGVSAVNPMRMFCEFTRITGRTMTSSSWWKGFIKASLLHLLNKLPSQFGNKILSNYINWRIKHL